MPTYGLPASAVASCASPAPSSMFTPVTHARDDLRTRAIGGDDGGDAMDDASVTAPTMMLA